MESHSNVKRSFHILLRITDNNDNKEILIENVQVLKKLYKEFDLGIYKSTDDKYIVDPSVYREGLFRTLYSSKNGEIRPLIRSETSDDFQDIEAFVCYHNNNFKI